MKYLFNNSFYFTGKAFVWPLSTGLVDVFFFSIFKEADKKDGHPVIHANSPDITESESNKRHASQTPVMMKAEDNISIQRFFISHMNFIFSSHVA